MEDHRSPTSMKGPVEMYAIAGVSAIVDFADLGELSSL